MRSTSDRMNTPNEKILSPVPSEGQTASQEMPLQKDQNALPISKSPDQTTERSEDEEGVNEEAPCGILDYRSGTERQVVKRSSSSDDHSQKRVLFNRVESCTTMEKVGSSSHMTRNRSSEDLTHQDSSFEGASNVQPLETTGLVTVSSSGSGPFGSTTTGIRTFHERNYYILDLVVPRAVYEANIINNIEPESRLLASIAAATSITAQRISEAVPNSLESDTADSTEEYELDTYDTEENTSLQHSLSSRDRSIQTPLLSTSAMQLQRKYIMLEELLMSSQLWNQTDTTMPPLQGSCPADFTQEDLLNTGRFIFTNTLKQHRRLSALKQLPMADQLALMNGRIRELVLCRFCIKHNTKTGKSNVGYPGSPEIPSEVSPKHQTNCSSDITKLRNMFSDKYRSNESILVILSALFLFNPDTPGLTCKAAVEENRRNYMDLLEHYFESTFGETESRWEVSYLSTWINCLRLYVKTIDCNVVAFELDPATCELATFGRVLSHSKAGKKSNLP